MGVMNSFSSAPGVSVSSSNPTIKLPIMMKHRVLIPVFTLITALFTGGLARASVQGCPSFIANPAGFEVHRGINLSHWLSQDFNWEPRARWITRKDIAFIASEGFDHVRFPVDEKELWNEDGSRNEEAFEVLLQGIEWAREEHLRIILDMHVLRSHHFNAENEGGKNTLFEDPEAQQHLADLWKDLSATVGNVPNDMLAYEIMNEPVAEDPKDWNALVALVTKEIRKLEPNRVLVIGANMWQMPSSFPYLEIPEGDKNIILSFHTYAPMFLSHYKASWTPLKDYEGPVSYPGPIIPQEVAAQAMEAYQGPYQVFIKKALDDWGPERIQEEIQPAIDRAKELGLQLYCGEFGTMPSFDEGMRLEYYRDLVGVFEANGIGWANWEYKGQFGIYEWFDESMSAGAPNMALIDALMQR